MSSIEVKINVTHPKLVYTSGDVIAGVVVVKVAKPISVDAITLKYKCEASTRFTVFESGDFGPEHIEKYHDQRGRTKHETEKVYQKALVLFPPKDLPAPTEGKGYTVPAGVYNYDFSIQLPGTPADNYYQLPPSFTDPEKRGEIGHVLKVTVKRPGTFQMNTRVNHKLEFTPSANVNLLNDRSLFLDRQMVSFQANKKARGLLGGSQKGPPVNLLVEAEFPRVVAQAPHQIPLELRVRTVDREQQIGVRLYEILLVSTTTFVAKEFKQLSSKSVTLAHSERWDVGNVFDFASSIGTPVVGDVVVPTFSTRLIQHHWHISVQVEFADPSNSKSGVSAVLSDRVRVLPTEFYGPPSSEKSSQLFSSVEQSSVGGDTENDGAYEPELHGASEKAHPPPYLK